MTEPTSIDQILDEFVATLELTEEKRELPCCAPEHDTLPFHDGPGYYWVIGQHPCFFYPHQMGVMVLLCKPVVDWFLQWGDERRLCPDCEQPVNAAEIFTVVGTVND